MKSDHIPVKIEINAATESLRKSHLTLLLEEFVSAHMNGGRSCRSTPDNSGPALDENTYSAALWMAGCRMNIISEHEAALRAGISSAALRALCAEQHFNAMVRQHVRDFLELVITVLT
ncbi:MAG: hypothetical protein N3B18_13390 [Desulfobacterota bacterium]|nr:hypothetical protein [Thermodesulfobacteriota bacterium]